MRAGLPQDHLLKPAFKTLEDILTRYKYDLNAWRLLTVGRGRLLQ